MQLMTKRNATRTILWPAPSAWTNVKLAKLLPSVDLTRIDNRVRAMKILALYMLSYQEVGQGRTLHCSAIQLWSLGRQAVADEAHAGGP